MSHTPGPWTIEDDSPSSIWARGQYIAETYENAEANARLIAAAPDLLAALKDLVNELRSSHGSASEFKAWCYAVDTIAKAEIPA